MIKISNLHKSFRTELIETQALRNINLSVAEGEFVALTGPSGSGKSTLLNVLGTLENFDSGEYLLDGKSLHGLGDRELSKIRNEKIGFIFQGFNLIKDYSIADNIELPLRYRGFTSAERQRRITRVLELVGLSSRREYYPSQLSGGQQQRVAIARALAGEPRILLADINLQGCTILMVTHDLDQARRAHRQIQIIDGHLTDSALYDPLVQVDSFAPACV
jgi:putative ABC transport system ATP-binding protein